MTKVDTYKGDVTVTVVDELPYEIDEEKSVLSGGTYNKEEKTITWTQDITGIDTFTNEYKRNNI